MYLLLDECCPKALVGIAENLGHAAQRTIEVAALGRQASDAAIFAFAVEAVPVVVTVNRGDFVGLAARRPDHPGLIVLPSVPPAETVRLFKSALRACEDGAALEGHLVEIDASGRTRRTAVPETSSA